MRSTRTGFRAETRNATRANEFRAEFPLSKEGKVFLSQLSKLCRGRNFENKRLILVDWKVKKKKTRPRMDFPRISR